MEENRRSAEEEHFEQLCVDVDADEIHEQEAIEYFEQHIGNDGFDAAGWLDVALYYSPAVARGVIDFLTPEDKARSNIAEIIADNLDIAYGESEYQQFAEVLQFARANGIPIDFDLILDGCQRALDDMQDWASEEDRTALINLRDELHRMKDE